MDTGEYRKKGMIIKRKFSAKVENKAIKIYVH